MTERKYGARCECGWTYKTTAPDGLTGRTYCELAFAEHLDPILNYSGTLDTWVGTEGHRPTYTDPEEHEAATIAQECTRTGLAVYQVAPNASASVKDRAAEILAGSGPR